MLSRKAEKLAKEGLVVIGVTDESPTLVDPWVADNEPEFPIVILEDDEFENFIGVSFFPTAAVIDAEGRLAYSGDARSYEKALEAALDEADDGPLFPKALKKTMEAYDEGELGEAYDEVCDISLDRLDDREIAWVRKMKTWFEELAVKRLADARQDVEDGWIYRAYRSVATFTESKRGLPNAEDLQAFLDEVEARDDFDDEMDGGELFAEAEEECAELEYLDAVKTLQRLCRRYEGTAIARHALARARELVDGRFTGMKPTCNTCRSRGYACKRHFESVDL